MTSSPTTTSTKRRVVIEYDQGYTEDPSEYSLFGVVSFGRRHGNYQDPDVVLACHHEDDEGWRCDEMPNHEIHEEEHEDFHRFVPDPDNIFMLSYFEHGLCRWGITGTMDPNRSDFRWDGVYAAGMLKWDPSEGDKDGSERQWWDELSDERHREIASAFLEEYTDWCNGHVYYVKVEEWVPDVCGSCGQDHEGDGYWNELDSCGGIIGSEWAEKYPSEAMGYDLPEGTEVIWK